jgi:rod shape-determining protein MreD
VPFVRFLAALAAAALLQAAGAMAATDFPRFVDPFLVVTLVVALGRRPLLALAAGTAAGWCADALAGGPFGLLGFADGATGYAAAVAAQRLVVDRRSSRAGLFAAGAAFQGALLALLAVALRPASVAPDALALGARVLTTVLLGLVWTTLAAALGRRWRARRRRPSGGLDLPKSLLP